MARTKDWFCQRISHNSSVNICNGFEGGKDF